MPELFHQLLVSSSLLNRIEISPLDVFDNRNLKNFGIVEVAHQHWQFMKLCHLGSAPAALARNNLKGALCSRSPPHDQRLDNALFPNRGRKIIQLICTKAAPGLIRVRKNLLDRNQKVWSTGLVAVADPVILRRNVRHQGRQTTAQAACLGFVLAHGATPSLAATRP